MRPVRAAQAHRPQCARWAAGPVRRLLPRPRGDLLCLRPGPPLQPQPAGPSGLRHLLPAQPGTDEPCARCRAADQADHHPMAARPGLPELLHRRAPVALRMLPMRHGPAADRARRRRRRGLRALRWPCRRLRLPPVRPVRQPSQPRPVRPLRARRAGQRPAGRARGAIAPQLEPLATALAAAPSPFPAIQWIKESPNTRLLAQLAAEGRTLSHELLDELPPSRNQRYIRQLLVHTGVLDERNEDLERIPGWLEHELDGQAGSARQPRTPVPALVPAATSTPAGGHPPPPRVRRPRPAAPAPRRP